MTEFTDDELLGVVPKPAAAPPPPPAQPVAAPAAAPVQAPLPLAAPPVPAPAPVSAAPPAPVIAPPPAPAPVATATPPPPAQAQAPPPVPPPAAPTRTAVAAGLDDEDVVPPPKNPTGGAAATESTYQPSTAISWDDDDVTKGGDGLDRITVEKGSDKTVRFAILEYFPPLAHKTHWVQTKQGKFQYLCLSTKNDAGVCCQKQEQEARVHVVALALQYTNANPKNGKYEKGSPIEYKVGFVDLSRKNFKILQDMPPEGTNIFDMDVAMSRDGNNFHLSLRSMKARWKMNPQLAAEVEKVAKAAVADGGRKLERKLGKRLSVLEWKSILSGASPDAEHADMSDVEEL